MIVKNGAFHSTRHTKYPKTFIQTEFSDTICINFLSLRNDLAYDHYAKIILQVHWDLMKRDDI